MILGRPINYWVGLRPVVTLLGRELGLFSFIGPTYGPFFTSLGRLLGPCTRCWTNYLTHYHTIGLDFGPAFKLLGRLLGLLTLIGPHFGLIPCMGPVFTLLGPFHIIGLTIGPFHLIGLFYFIGPVFTLSGRLLGLFYQIGQAIGSASTTLGLSSCYWAESWAFLPYWADCLCKFTLLGLLLSLFSNIGLSFRPFLRYWANCWACYNYAGLQGLLQLCGTIRPFFDLLGHLFPSVSPMIGPISNIKPNVGLVVSLLS